MQRNITVQHNHHTLWKPHGGGDRDGTRVASVPVPRSQALGGVGDEGWIQERPVGEVESADWVDLIRLILILI